jgi:hypothetical protein
VHLLFVPGFYGPRDAGTGAGAVAEVPVGFDKGIGKRQPILPKDRNRSRGIVFVIPGSKIQVSTVDDRVGGNADIVEAKTVPAVVAIVLENDLIFVIFYLKIVLFPGIVAALGYIRAE